MAVIVVQSGHMGRTSGATGAAGEQTFTEAAGRETVNRLLAAGFDVNWIPADTELGEYAGDAFVSIHADGATDPQANGASVGYRTDEGQALANAWKDAYVAAGWSRRFRADNYTKNLAGYYGVKNAVRKGNRAAIIVEAGFLTNPDDRELIDPARMATAIVGACAAVVGAPAVPPVPPPPPPPADQPSTAFDPTEVIAMLPMLRRQSGFGGDPNRPFVRRLQGLLLAWGYGLGAGGVDGLFGGDTLAAVQAFQIDHEPQFGADGIVGGATWTALIAKA